MGYSLKSNSIFKIWVYFILSNLSLNYIKYFFTNLQANASKMNKYKKSFSFKARVKSIKYAFCGIVDFFQTEHNALIHLIVAIFAIGFSIWLSISREEWIIIISMIGLVFMAELFNTAIEKMGDLITKENNVIIKKVKDFSAAAVLIASIVAFLIGLIIFIPHLVEKIEMNFRL
jgi:diacylglycerol kinase (ATP)